jgi:hypothetical protein
MACPYSRSSRTATRGQIPTGGTFVGQGQIEDITAVQQRRGKDIEARRGSAGLRRVTSGILGSDADLGIDEDTKKKTKTSIKARFRSDAEVL